MSSKDSVISLLKSAGIEVNGGRPWDMKVHNDAFYGRVLGGGSVALGESYVDGWWDVEQLDEFFTRVLHAELEQKVEPAFSSAFSYLRSRLFNLPRLRAWQVGTHHYDRGNDLFEAMLDRRMVYSCGYWKNADSLDRAQEDKLELICRKIGLESGHSVLDIGSGWGGFINFAAERYDARAVGVTVSREQAGYANAHRSTPHVETRLIDYHGIGEKFDRVVSIGMFEHVGYKNYRAFMKKVHEVLADGGLFLLHTIGRNESGTTTDPWIHKYIFPNSMLPSAKQIAAAVERLFVIEDWHSFGQYYDTTLMSWFGNFDTHWPALREKYGERFYRMWKYYLLATAGSFRSRKNQVWQIVFSKLGVPGGYTSIR